jgi:hypothetical protein
MGELYCGDCLEELTNVADNSVDLVMLDLPYGITDAEWDVKIDLKKLWEQLKRVGKERTAYFFFATFKFGAEILASNPNWFGFELIWNKKHLTNPFNARKHHNRSHENIYVFYKKCPNYYYQDYHTRSLSGKTQNEDATKLWSSTKTAGWKENKYEPALPTSVLEYTNQHHYKGQHPTKKPLALMEHLIKYYSKEGDTILDPTMGGGSTIKACISLNRNFIGIEKNEIFFNKLVKELNISEDKE